MKTASLEGTFVVKLLPRADLTAFGKLINSRAQIGIDEDHIWVRYKSHDEQASLVASWLNGHHFQLLDDELLIPLGASVATERLPKLDWQKLAAVVDFKLPTAALSGRLPAMELPELKLLRGGVERPASAGLFALDEFASWVHTAPQFRLNRLLGCISCQDVLVIGNPLPPITCEFLCQDERLLTPAGMTWYPRIDSARVLEHFDVAAGHILLWTKTDQWSSIPLDLIKPVRRASVRAFVGSLRT